MKKGIVKIVSLTILLLICAFVTFAQSISPEPGYTTVCPDESVRYTVNPNPDFSGCGTYTWTLTNGTFSLGQTVTSTTTTTGYVDVYWKDVAGNGTIKVTSTCDQGAMSVGPLTYAIRSLAGRAPANTRANQTLPFCSTTAISLQTDVMFLQNTGGATNIPQQRADGYEWTLPTGWSFSGSSTTEIVTIFPDNGCRQGTATVKAYVNCSSGRKYSNSASVSLARTYSVAINFPTGYSGPSCGDTAPRTFTVSGVPACASNISWSFPAGWKGPNNTPSPILNLPGTSITLTPSGTAGTDGVSQDAGTIYATVNLSCGTSIPQTTRTLTFTRPIPTVDVSQPVCHGSNRIYTLTNIPGGTTGISWSATPTINTSLFVGATSGSGSTATLTSANSGTKGFANLVYTVTGACPSTTTRKIWVGKPGVVDHNDYPTTISLQPNTSIARSPLPCIIASQIDYTYARYLGIVDIDFNKIKGASGSVSWTGSYAGANVSANTRGITFYPNGLGSPYYGSGYVSASMSNTCGSSVVASAGYGACSSAFAFSAYPNPSTDQFTVEAIAEQAPEAPDSVKTKVKDFEVRVLNSGNMEVLPKVKSSGGKSVVNLSAHPDGFYYLQITSGPDHHTITVQKR